MGAIFLMTLREYGFYTQEKKKKRSLMTASYNVGGKHVTKTVSKESFFRSDFSKRMYCNSKWNCRRNVPVIGCS